MAPEGFSLSLTKLNKDGSDGTTMALKFGDVVVFGRADSCDVQLKLSAVSRIHCNVTVDENGGAQLENLSQNGTDLNGMMLPKQGRCELKHDDTFALGNRRFRFCKANVDAATVAKQAFAPAAADDDTTELPRGMPFALVSKASRQSLGVALAVADAFKDRCSEPAASAVFPSDSDPAAPRRVLPVRLKASIQARLKKVEIQAPVGPTLPGAAPAVSSPFASATWPTSSQDDQPARRVLPLGLMQGILKHRQPDDFPAAPATSAHFPDPAVAAEEEAVRPKLPKGLLSGVISKAKSMKLAEVVSADAEIMSTTATVAAAPAPPFGMLARQMTISNDAESVESPPPLPTDLLQGILALRKAAALEQEQEEQEEDKAAAEEEEAVVDQADEQPASDMDEDGMDASISAGHNLATVMETSMEDHETDEDAENDNAEAAGDGSRNDDSFATASSKSPASAPSSSVKQDEDMTKEVSRLSYVQDKLLVEGYAAALVRRGEVGSEADAYNEAVSTYLENREAFGTQLVDIAEVPREAIVEAIAPLAAPGDTTEEKTVDAGTIETSIKTKPPNGGKPSVEKATEDGNVEITLDLSEAMATIFGVDQEAAELVKDVPPRDEIKEEARATNPARMETQQDDCVEKTTHIKMLVPSPAKLISDAAVELQRNAAIDVAAAEYIAVASLVAGAAAAEAAIKHRQSSIQGGLVAVAPARTRAPSPNIVAAPAAAAARPAAEAVVSKQQMAASNDSSVVQGPTMEVTMDVSNVMSRLFAVKGADKASVRAAARAANSRRLTLDLAQVLPTLFANGAVEEQQQSGEGEAGNVELTAMTEGARAVAPPPEAKVAALSSESESHAPPAAAPSPAASEASTIFTAQQLVLDYSASLERLFKSPNVSPRAPATAEQQEQVTSSSGLGKRKYGNHDGTASPFAVPSVPSPQPLLIANDESMAPSTVGFIDRLFAQQAVPLSKGVSAKVTAVGVDESLCKGIHISEAILARATVAAADEQEEIKAHTPEEDAAATSPKRQCVGGEVVEADQAPVSAAEDDADAVAVAESAESKPSEVIAVEVASAMTEETAPETATAVQSAAMNEEAAEEVTEAAVTSDDGSAKNAVARVEEAGEEGAAAMGAPETSESPITDGRTLVVCASLPTADEITAAANDAVAPDHGHETPTPASNGETGSDDEPERIVLTSRIEGNVVEKAAAEPAPEDVAEDPVADESMAQVYVAEDSFVVELAGKKGAAAEDPHGKLAVEEHLAEEAGTEEPLLEPSAEEAVAEEPRATEEPAIAEEALEEGMQEEAKPGEIVQAEASAREGGDTEDPARETADEPAPAAEASKAMAVAEEEIAVETTAAAEAEVVAAKKEKAEKEAAEAAAVEEPEEAEEEELKHRSLTKRKDVAKAKAQESPVAAKPAVNEVGAVWPTVGQHIRVWFEEEATWTLGVVTKVTKPRSKRTKKGKIYVEYEDGDEGFCDFPEEGIEIVKEGVNEEMEKTARSSKRAKAASEEPRASARGENKRSAANDSASAAPKRATRASKRTK